MTSRGTGPGLSHRADMGQDNTYIPKRARNLVALSVTHSPPTPPTLAFCSAQWFESFDGDRLADAIEMITLLETHELLVTWGGLAPVRDAAEAHGIAHPFSQKKPTGEIAVKAHSRVLDLAAATGSEPTTQALWSYLAANVRDGVMENLATRPEDRRTPEAVAEAIRTSAVAHILNERPAALSSMSEGISSGSLASGDGDD